MTECKTKRFDFHALSNREVIGHFDGGDISSDAGGLLLREVEQRTGILKQFAECFTDYRKQEWIEHPVQDLLAQKAYAMCLGYEDLNDHDQLRADPGLAVMVGKTDPKGEHRIESRNRGKALAGKSTLNRLELTKADASAAERYKKIVMNPEAIDQMMVDQFLDAHPQPKPQIILDMDATDDPIHGHQEGRFFHGYYDCYCYLPLYIFCDEFLLSAKLRTSDIDPAKGALEDLKRVVSQIRKRWPKVHILVRGDSGFCRDAIMTWCERQGIDYVFGLAKNSRLLKEIEADMKAAEAKYFHSGEPVRIFKNFRYRTLEDTWSRTRRVVAKAEHLKKGSNPRFVVTSLPQYQFPAPIVYQTIYSLAEIWKTESRNSRWDCLPIGSVPNPYVEINSRLYCSSIAYLLMHALRRLALKGTDLENAQCTTIRLKLLKIGAQIEVTVRRVWFRFAASYPYKQSFQQAFKNLRAIPLPY